MHTVDTGSFRDNSGFVFKVDNKVYRQVNLAYKRNYEHLMCGLYAKLVKEGLLVKHDEITEQAPVADLAYKIIKPEQIEFISYPYEWSFSQLKDAALLTLKIQRIAFEHGMILKDASAYNIQFKKGLPIFIDTLSFEVFQEGTPWNAYRQFCQHFLAPLLLMSYTDVNLNNLLKIYIDGIPIDLASKLLPMRSYFNFGALFNIHLHARSQKKYENVSIDKEKIKLSRQRFMAIINGLEQTIAGIQLSKQDTEWGDYYNITNYSDEAFSHKIKLVETYLRRIGMGSVWDLGANRGVFSRVASNLGNSTIAFDIDPIAVEKNYREVKKNGEGNLLPLIMDLTNPSSSIGWNNEERASIKERHLPNVILALALIHHIAISNNVPLDKIAEFLASLCNYLVIEFVPKSDSQVKKLLSTREDIFPGYTQDNFEHVFSKYFNIIEANKVNQSDRTLYLLVKK